ncbi:MAG: acetate--CoA ligase family protein [Candidatus Micrarchaeia archaeon]
MAVGQKICRNQGAQGESNGPGGSFASANGLVEGKAGAVQPTFSEALQLLRQNEVPIVGNIVHSAEEAQFVVKKIFDREKIALKAATMQKSKKAAGLVEVNVSAEDVHGAYERIAEKSGSNEIFIAPMANNGIELVVGARMTEYGVAVLVGAGGSLTEKMKDVQICIEPATMEDVLDKISRLREFPLLNGERGCPKVCMEEVAEIALHLAEIVRNNPSYEIDLNPVRAYGRVASALDFRVVLNENFQARQETPMPQGQFNKYMRAALNAKSIAFIGASDRVIGMAVSDNRVVGIERVEGEVATVRTATGTCEMKAGAEVLLIDSPMKTLAKNLLGFPGNAYFVNPKGGELLGRKAYASIGELPEVPDMAVILIDAAKTIDALEECGKKGIKTVVIESSGFKEVGNIELEAKLKEVIARYGMIVIGPNGIGVCVPGNGIDLMFLAQEKNGRLAGGGKTSIFSQSGSIAAIMMDNEARLGGKMNAFLSVGNMSGVTSEQLLRYFGQDKGTKVIGVILEGLPDGKEFMEAASEIGKTKPIVVLKLGKTSGEKTASHTGSLAGDYNAFLAAAEKSGVIVAENIDQFWLACKILETQPLPATGSVAFVTNAGGHLTHAYDQMTKEGVPVSSLEPGTVETIKSIVSKNATITNAAIDLVADSNPVVVDGVVRALVEDKNVGFIYLAPFPGPPTLTEPVLGKIASHQGEKPIAVLLNTSPLATEWRAKLEGMGVPTTTSHEDAAQATRAIINYAAWRKAQE